MTDTNKMDIHNIFAFLGPAICVVLLLKMPSFLHLIMQMEKEIRELTKQRDLAESRVQDLLQMVGNDRDSRQVHIIALFYLV